MGGLAHVGGVLATIARSCAIWGIALACVAAYAVGALRRLAIRDRAARAGARARQRGALLRWSFSRLGATFIKIGQVMSSRADLFAPGVLAELRQLQDHVPPFSAARARAIVERELKAPIAAVFRSFDDAPVAAGSIAQVHRAILACGDEVAVKIVRPGVRARARRDARILLWLAHVAFALSARARAADVIGHARSIIAAILGQLDLRREADNYERFRADFARTEGIAFPRVYHEVSTRDVLVMEFVHGVHLDHIPARQVPQVTRALRDAFFAMCFEHGLVHADLHPGNLLVRPDGTVVVLDVGLVKQLAGETIELIVDFARCLVMGSAADLVEHLRRHHRYRKTTDWREVVTDVHAFVLPLRSACIAQLELACVVSRLFALARKHHIRPQPELAVVLLGMVTLEGIAKRLDPSANTIAEVTRYLAPRAWGARRFPRGSRPPATVSAAREDAEPAREPTAPAPSSSRRALGLQRPRE